MRTLTYIAFAFAFVELLLFATNHLGNQQRYAFGIAQLQFGFYLLTNSSFKSTKLYSLILLSIGVLFSGLFFRIFKWSNGFEMILLGCIGCISLYGIRFWNKESKSTLDYSKLVWVLGTFGGYLALTLQKISFDQFYYASILVLTAAIGSMALNYRKAHS